MIFGALVVLLIGLTLAFLIIPVLRKPPSSESTDREQQNIAIAREKKVVLESQLAEGQMTQQEFDAAMGDLEASLALDLERQQALQDNQQAGRWVVWLFVVAIPVFSVLMYMELGEYRVIENPDLAQPKTVAQNPTHGSGQLPSIEEMIEKVKSHLRDNPDDSKGWFILGRTYMSLQQYPEAVTAFQRCYDLSPQETSVMLALADALAMTSNGNMLGEPEQLVLKALQVKPDEPTGLWLAGLAAEQGGRTREAFDYWTRLLPTLEDDPQSREELQAMLLQLKQKNPDLPDFELATASVTEQGLKVEVTLDPGLSGQVKPGDLLFIYAKAAEGPPMPLAAKRLTVADLPVQVSLSDQDAMMPQMALSKFDQIIVGARISKSGNPVAQSGDLFDESEIITHKSFDGTVSISIDKVKP